MDFIKLSSTVSGRGKVQEPDKKVEWHGTGAPVWARTVQKDSVWLANHNRLLIMPCRDVGYYPFFFSDSLFATGLSGSFILLWKTAAYSRFMAMLI